MKKAQKSTVQFYVRHKAKLNVYSLVCLNLSQPISTRRKRYFKYVRALTKKKCRQNRVQNACLFLNNRFVHFASEIRIPILAIKADTRYFNKHL